MDRTVWLPRLDDQLARWTQELTSDVRVSREQSLRVASLVATELHNLPKAEKQALRAQDPIASAQRLDELRAFQAFMDWASTVGARPEVTRAQVVSQLYVCFVYLGDSCFRPLKKQFASSTVTGRCSRFLLDNPVRAFRNAVAHANWRYAADFSGIKYFARKGADPDEALTEWFVTQETLEFWQALARGVAYAALTELDGAG